MEQSVTMKMVSSENITVNDYLNITIENDVRILAMSYMMYKIGKYFESLNVALFLKVETNQLICLDLLLMSFYNVTSQHVD